MTQHSRKQSDWIHSLTEIERLLSEAEQGHVDWSSARGQWKSIATAATQNSDTELQNAARLLSQIAELAEIVVTDGEKNQDEQDLEAVSALAIQTFKSRLEDHSSSGEQLQDLVKTIQKNWGDSLELLETETDEDTSCHPVDEWEAGADNWLEESLDDFSGDSEFQANDPSNEEPANQPSSEDVSRLLAALSEVEPADSPEDTESQQNAETSTQDDFPFEDAQSGLANYPSPPEPENIRMNPHLLEAYLDDVNKGLASMEQAVLQLEENPQNQQSLQQLCRELHTLKGASASVGLPVLARYLHEVEDAVQSRMKPSSPETVDVDAILQSVDVVREQIAALKSPQQSSSSETAQGEADDTSSPKTTPAFTPGLESSAGNHEETLRVKASQLDRLMDMLAELVMLRNRRETRVEELKSINGELTRCSARLRGSSDGSLFATMPNHPESQQENSTPQTNSPNPRLKYLSEIATDLTEITRNIRNLYKPVAEENQVVSRFIRQFRQELMELRRLPISGLFQRLQRSVRDAARVENKQVRLELVGEHAGMERSLQERIYEPLLHLVRNAVSHGIEPAEDRIAIGKDPTGTIVLEARGEPNLLILEVRDDGDGLNYDALRRRGIERGLINPDHHPTRSELARLIFHPGFSTRDQAGEISGRGVGMDVVASTLERLHARIDVESEPGEGTTIRLTIPLHSVIEHTMVVRVSGQLFALPTQFVRAVGRPDQLKADTISEISTSNDKPPISLGELLLLPAVRSRKSSEELETVTIGRDLDSQRVLIVDEVIGPEEVVVRSLPPLLKRHRLFTGVTLSGAGETVLLLSSQKLLELTGTMSTLSLAKSTQSDEGRGHHFPHSQRLKVLVVDDSLSARRVLIQKIQSQLDCEITEAGDGREALDIMRDHEFSIVFTDMEMPRMGGMELLGEIKNGHRRDDIRVVLATSRGEEGFRAQARSLGVDGYITKPVNDRALLEVLEKLGITTNPSTSHTQSSTERAE
ncbi:MAG: hypothetical protein Tsb009_31210 [Planctomycetaceae bacterium]